MLITCTCCSGQITLDSYTESEDRILEENPAIEGEYREIAHKVVIKNKKIFICTNCYRQKSIELKDLEKKRNEILLREELHWKEWIKAKGAKHAVYSICDKTELPLTLTADLLFFKTKTKKRAR